MAMPPERLKPEEPAAAPPATCKQRAALARGLSERPAAFFQTPTAAGLLADLAADPRPQVRQAVAVVLDRLPEPLFADLHAQLASDDNHFVLHAAQRAAQRRAQAARAARQTRFGVDQVAAHLRRIEKRHGDAAAHEAGRLCERYTQLLVGSMVHDLRSVLTHLKANTLALLADAGNSTDAAGGRRGRLPARVRDDLEFLERTVLDMEQFTAPLEAGRQPERLIDLVRAALEIAATSVQANQEVDPATVAVEVDVADGLRVAVARHQVVTALANVLKNAYEAFIGGWPRHTRAVAGNSAVVDGAADAAPEPGPPTAAASATALQAGSASSAATQRSQIAIAARRAGETVVLVIRDNGMGFAQEEADALHLFTPGRRNKTKRNSTGYGLPNAARKIMAQGGSIQFESREGRGAVVTVRLPAASEGCAP